MECDICGKAGGFNYPVHCITCARAFIELPRIELARALIDRDKVGRHVKAVVEGSEDKASQHVPLTDSRGGILVDRHECTKNVDLQRTQAETAETEERVQLIADQAALLRKRIDETRRQLEQKRASNAQRKSDLSSATYGIDSRRANEVDKVQQAIKRADYKSGKVHQETVEWRQYLCTTAAKLAGLKMTRRKVRDGGMIKEVYSIGPGSRLRIYDLRELHEAQSDMISASLNAVAHLVVRVSAYLGVRLPAEITLPHTEYPQATVFQPASSYQGKKVPYPGSTPSHSSTNSPEASRTLEALALLPKPRTLTVDRPLPALAAEDPREYALFIEGVSLLAYDIAWLCRTQGLKNDFNSWEDACPMGLNLYRLLVLQESRKPQQPDNQAAGKQSVKVPVGLGELSHATSYSFMNAANNVAYLSGWKLTPTKIVDELKSHFTAEQQAQEWDVLNQKEWEDMEDVFAEDPVVIGDKRKGSTALNDGRSNITTSVAGSRAADLSGDDSARPKRGVSGWTKLKSRSEDTTKQSIPE
ncbi:UV radiation resistance protein and autophagy-related subunit 14-domain-containing protein [Lophiotrema nucula]|uniref:Autophagy-related protein 14 n=1 Tax=Lophiotrema nucula TaxID=690887 RepID=A0A6A5ZH13_9PLEO|nr:UV radiation resistance protein and autophagy-related subunit 14-domain-containing protein [Lophiotrema nucula]